MRPLREAARIYEGLLGQGHYFMDGAVEMLQALYGSFHLYLATNGTASVQKSRLKSAEIEPFLNRSSSPRNWAATNRKPHF